MENNELQKMWKGIDDGIQLKSKEELNLLLQSKAKQSIGMYLIISTLSIVASVSLLVFLSISAAKRVNDTPYLLNNIILGLITLFAFFSGIVFNRKMRYSTNNVPFKIWLEKRVAQLSKYFTGRLSKFYYISLPVIYVLTILSIHVYFEQKDFVEVLKNEESIIGLIIGSVIGLTVSIFTVRKVRKFQFRNYEFLKDLYERLCRE